MGSHKHKKNYDSSSSSAETDSSSSPTETRKKAHKHSKKAKHSSTEESDDEEVTISKKRNISGGSSEDSDKERTKRKKKKDHYSEEGSSRHHKYKESTYRSNIHKEDKYQETYKNKNKQKSTDRSKDKDRDSDKPREREPDENRYKKDHSNREKYDDNERNRRHAQDYIKDERRIRDQKDSRQHRGDEEDRGRNRAGEGDRYRERGEYRNQRGSFRHGNRGRRSSSFDHANARWGKNDSESKPAKKEAQDKEKPNFGLSGKLTEETNTYKGVVIKYSEPPESRKPRRRWRLYPFKGEKALQTLYIHRNSAYLIGRERKIVDLPVDHPSCSKQHAALQYRLVPFTRDDGTTGKRVRPYLIDLESANGTFLNNKKIEAKKYVELFEKDVIKFGFSSREYVLLHENSKDEAMDDDVKQEEEELPVKQERD